jgi:hypothetical protein
MKNLKFMENPSGHALKYKMKEYNKSRSKNIPFVRSIVINHVYQGISFIYVVINFFIVEKSASEEPACAVCSHLLTLVPRSRIFLP